MRTFLAGKPQRKRETFYAWEDDIESDLREIGFEGPDWI
jgi:hypothetical protein